MLRGLIQRRWLLGAVWTIGSLVLVANLGFSAYYQDKILPNTRIGAVAVGGLTPHQATQKVASSLAEYKLQIHVDNHAYLASPKEFGGKYEVAVSVAEAYRLGHDTPVGLWGWWTARQRGPIVYTYSVDRAKLHEFALKISLSQAQAPTDASVTVVNGKPQVASDKDGYGVDEKGLASAIESGLNEQAEQVKVDRSAISADVSADEAKVAADNAAKMIATKVTLVYEDKKFEPTSSQIGEWMSFVKENETLIATPDVAKIKTYLTKYVDSSINIAAQNKEVSVVNGQTKGEKGGKDGLAVSDDELAGSIAGKLKEGVASAELAVPTHVVAYKTIYNRTVELTEGRYIEVSISKQHVWAYDDHKVVFESAVTTGATGAGFATVEGIFAIYYKTTNFIMDGYHLGYNYRVHVDYWMPFYKDYGLHDADWRSSFGGPDYYYNGSHGCVNLPKATAAFLYNWSTIGTPVWVHK